MANIFNINSMALWMVYALGSAIFAALVAIFGKLGSSSIDPLLATTLRSIIMTLVLASVALLHNTFQLQLPTNKTWLYIVLAGIAGASSWLCYFLALKYGPASGVAALDRLSVVLVVILAAGFLGEKLTWLHGLGATLITIGTMLLIK